MTHETEFQIFWNAYPKRVGRKRAEEAFAKAIKKTTLDTMLRAIAWQKRQPQWLKDGGAYIIYPQGWLNQERWTDQPTDQPQISEKNARSFSAIFGTEA
jgi:hypothetical protein